MRFQTASEVYHVLTNSTLTICKVVVHKSLRIIEHKVLLRFQAINSGYIISLLITCEAYTEVKTSN